MKQYFIELLKAKLNHGNLFEVAKRWGREVHVQGDILKVQYLFEAINIYVEKF